MIFALESFDFIKSIEHKYDYIFTHDRRLIESNPNKFLFVIPASWRKHFPDNHVNFYENKEKIVSFAYSNKRITKGHNYRHELGQILGDKVNQMGTGTKVNPCANRACGRGRERSHCCVACCRRRRKRAKCPSS